MKVNYNLKTPGAKISIIQLKFTYNRNQFRISTGLKVSSDSWNKEIHRVRGRGVEANQLNENLRLIYDEVLKYVNVLPYSESRSYDEVKERVERAIGYAINGYYTSRITDKVPLFLLSNPNRSISNINDAIQAYLEKNKLTLSDGRQRHYRSCMNVLNNYRLGFTNIQLWSVETFEEFRDLLINDGKRNDTILMKIKMIKAVLRNYDPTHPALLFKFTTDAKHDQPTLSEDELEQLRSASIPSDLCRTRDLFLFQCCTGQRISDIRIFKKGFITDGLWIFRQKKTAKLVKVPLNKEAMAILENYNYELPIVSDQYHNRNLKDMARLAKLDRVVHIERKSGIKDIHISRPMYEVIATHMARRIFITHNLNAGKPIHLIARITGQSLVTLQKYEQAGEEALKNFW